MSLTVVLATRNPGKVREFARLLGGALTLEPLPADIPLPAETGRSFAENAALKAGAVFRRLGGRAPVLADDSGLEVAALGGEPGIRSARYAGEAAGDRENVAQLLAQLAGVEDREARFVCRLSLYLPRSDTRGAGRTVEVEGVLPGVIEHEPRGSEGFGYDPVFRPKGWDRTLSEASGKDKDDVSHRAEAARALLQVLRTEGVI